MMPRSAVLASIAALASAAALPRRGAAAAAPAVRVAFDPIDAACNLFTAQAQGFFTRAGLAVDLQQMVNGSAGAAAVLSGALEVTNINVASLLSAYAQKIPFAVIALGEIYTSTSPTLQMLVTKDSPLQTARDLNGKTIAVNAVHGLASVASRVWADKNGGDSTTLHFAEMPFSVMATALSQRRVDAIFVAEPGLSIAKRSGDARVFASANDAIAPVFQVGVCVATRDWVAKNLDLARRFNQAMHEGSVFANRNHDRTAEIDSPIMHMPVEEIRAMTRATFPENQRATALIQPVIDAAARYGVVPPSTRADEMISTGVLR
jgi:NitT/TauT family transport system substrate-binding protein